jgi:hypothetical protein
MAAYASVSHSTQKRCSCSQERPVWVEVEVEVESHQLVMQTVVQEPPVARA